MSTALLEKRCTSCKMIKPLSEFALEPLSIGSLRKVEKYGDICIACRERLKTKAALPLTQSERLFSSKKIKKDDEGRGEGGRGKGSRLTIDSQSKLFAEKTAVLKLAAAQAEKRAASLKAAAHRRGLKK